MATVEPYIDTPQATTSHAIFIRLIVLSLPELQAELLKLSPIDIEGLSATEKAFDMLLGPLKQCQQQVRMKMSLVVEATH